MDSAIMSPVSGPRRRRFTCRRIDKLCCLVAGYFPLFFVYSLTSWALYTEVYSISWRAVGGYQGFFTGSLGVLLYAMVIWCYTFAVFTKPGSPYDTKNTYTHLPTTTTEQSLLSAAVTVKSDGQERFCKKCQFRKPDRAHHCSSCRTCVLKMDHHCPWLANCLGLYNYKAFLLFLIYTCLYSLLCFAVSCRLVYIEIFADSPSRYSGPPDDLTPVNWVLLAVISGIIGLVLSGFTIWHLILTRSNMTTIESLEKVRYTAPSLRNGAPPPGARFLDDYSDPDAERRHEVDRYSNYLLEESSKSLPHAFDLGRKRNFAQVFGGRDRMHMWFLPMFSGTGDGWNWETSREWRESAEMLKTERERWLQDQRERETRAGWGYDPSEQQQWNRGNPNGLIKHAGGKKQSKVDRILGRAPGSYTDSEDVPLRKLSRPVSVQEDTSDDDGDDDQPTTTSNAGRRDVEWGTWND